MPKSLPWHSCVRQSHFDERYSLTCTQPCSTSDSRYAKISARSSSLLAALYVPGGWVLGEIGG